MLEKSHLVFDKSTGRFKNKNNRNSWVFTTCYLLQLDREGGGGPNEKLIEFNWLYIYFASFEKLCNLYSY